MVLSVSISIWSSIYSHHKLQAIGIMSSRKPITARQEKWRLRLMPYRMDLIYRPGHDESNSADNISRYSNEIARCDDAGEAYSAHIVENVIPKSFTLKEVQSATRKDQQLQRVMQAIQTSHWMDPEAKDFNKFKDELSIYDGVILGQNCIIIPATLWQKTIAIAHQTHQDIVKKTTVHLRKYVVSWNW